MKREHVGALAFWTALCLTASACGGDSGSTPVGPEGTTNDPDTAAVVDSIRMKPPYLYIDSLGVQRQNAARAFTQDSGDIARIEVAKGAAATTLFGTGSANGVTPPRRWRRPSAGRRSRTPENLRRPRSRRPTTHPAENAPHGDSPPPPFSLDELVVTGAAGSRRVRERPPGRSS